MAFTADEIAEHMKVLEELFWSTHRPPLHLRDKIREGQRFKGRAIELFYVRPLHNRPGKQVEEPIAKIRHLPGLGVWRIYWRRANGRWSRYPPRPQVKSLPKALAVVNEDSHSCFFG